MMSDESFAVAPSRSADASVGLWTHVGKMVRWFRLALTIVTVIALVFLVLEAVRMFQTLHAINPALGYLSLVALGIGIALVVYPAWRFLKMPRVVEPPPIPTTGAMNARQLATELRYLDRYLSNCERNPSFESDRAVVERARQDLALLMAQAKGAPDAAVAVLSASLSDWCCRSLEPALANVDARAERLIYQEALSVGLATAASPNGVLDAFVMLWRSVRLVSEMGVLYYGRPGVFGTMAICRDVSMAVAVAGYMQNVSESLGGVLAKTLGGVGGVVAGPAVDGITNALVLIRIGYLAKARCRSYRRWDAAARRNAVLVALQTTQKVAFGLATEILRQVGWGVTAIAGRVATKVGEYGNTAKDAMGTAASAMGKAAGEAADVAARVANSAVSTAKNFGKAVGDMFKPDDQANPNSL